MAKPTKIEDLLGLIEYFCHSEGYNSAITMSPKEREVYNMRFVEEKPVVEIMAELGVCKNRVWGLINGAKEKIERQEKLKLFIKEYN